MTRQYEYDANTMRLTSLRAGVASPYTNLQNLSYTYDAAGNVASIVDGVNSSQRQCFGYDALDRLTTAFTGNAGCTAYATGGTGPYNHTYVYDAIGNLTSYAGNTYTYGDSAHKHAVTAAYGNTYGYDGNGNQTTRTIAGTTYTFTFDYENRLTEVKQGATSLATFLYDADGNRVKGTVSGVTTVYIAGIYEYQAGATTKYYEGGGLRRTGYSTNNGVFYMLSDHLKSTSALVARNGVLNVKYFYYPYGTRRGVPFNTITAKHFTGQYHETALPGGEGLSFYNARWYDPKLGRFLSPDTIVPNASNPQALNRYTYVLGNPLKFIDPTGHVNACGATGEDCGGGSARKSNSSSNGMVRTGSNGVTSTNPAQRSVPKVQSSKPKGPVPVRTIVRWMLNDEMLPNAQSTITQTIRDLNMSAPSSAVEGVRLSIARKDSTYLLTGLSSHVQALLIWRAMVQHNSTWDHKPRILGKYGAWSYDETTDYYYNYDVWSNIHYGYVGRAAGFAAWELRAGAGFGQITDKTSDPSYWRTWFDDPKDQAAIQIGIDLFDTYGLNVSGADVMQVFYHYAPLLTRTKEIDALQ